MAHEYEDEWETSSGLSLDGAVATIADMQFGFNNQISATAVCANLTLVTEDGEEIEQSFTVGGNNEASRDGTILEGSGKINKRSNFGLLIESVKDIIDNPAEVIGRVRDVSGWIGTTWTWGTVDMETTNPTTGEKSSKSKFIVTEYHGREGENGGKSSKSDTSPKGKSSSKSKDTSKSDTASHGGDDELWNTLVDLARNHDDHDSFVDAALDIDGVADNRDLQRSVMKTTEGSVWAEAKGA